MFEASEGTYGSPRVHAALQAAGTHVGRKRVARLIGEQGLRARSARIYRRTPGTRRFFGAVPNRTRDLHSDRGAEYAVYRCRARLAALGITQSMKRPRELGDNALIESFFHTLKSDVIHGATFATDMELLTVVKTYIRRYNRTRLHSSLGYRSPIDFERSTA